ncbi:hypothetical protein O6P43_000484 [Quillaja saponaria]|uniref:Uncharacterized protein n=1 Tax=Quillaja saponaria TaxID=32244 RepID=A0AAD7VME3_QUISA|nr:hypothetical protein O6P43_000484 [Quillaja saponaria]
MGECTELLATISCGGNISPSPSSTASSSSSNSRCLLLIFIIACDNTGTFTGADWLYFTVNEEDRNEILSGGGFGITGIKRQEDEDDEEDEDTDAFW